MATQDDPTRADYRDSIEQMADVVADQLADDPDAHPSDLIWEALDGSRWVIYTHESMAALEYAGNDPAEWKHLVGDDDSWHQVIQAMAYKAMEADLYDELREREGVDL